MSFTRCSTVVSKNNPGLRKHRASRTWHSKEKAVGSLGCQQPICRRIKKSILQKVLASMVEPYRQTDRDEAMKCIKAQGGLDACHLSFYTDKRHRQRQRVGQLAIGRPKFRLALSRRATRTRLGQLGRFA